jgi:uroporphyrinogen decarboxylase
MNARERVLTAIRHEQPDFVPYNFHGTAGVYEKARRHYNLPNNEALTEFTGSHIVKVGSDFNVNPWADNIKMQLVPSGGPVISALDASGGLHTDEFGCVWERKQGMPHPMAYPLAEDYRLLDSYKMPDPYRAGRFDASKALADRHRGKRFVFGKLGMALFERAWAIRGMQELLMDMATRPEWVEELLDRVVYEWNLPIIDQQIALGIDGFYFADDWGAKTGLIFSPAMWRRFIKPRMALCYQRVKEHGLVVGQHSDGNILQIMPDLIEIGLDVFNPLEPLAYDVYAVKEKYGHRLTFYGGIDVERTLPYGSPQEVRAEILERAERLGRGGGYILQSSHTILDDVPIENIVAYIETCHQLAGVDTQAAVARARAA